MDAGGVSQLDRIVGDVRRAGRAVLPHLAQEDLANLGAVAVDSRNQNVAGTVVAELNDQLRQVSLPSRDAFGLERLVEVCFLRHHGLNLGDLGLAGCLNQVDGDAVGLFGVTCPVDGGACRGGVLLKLQQVLVKVTSHAVLYVGTRLADLLPVVQLAGHTDSLVSNGVGRVVQVLALGVVLQLANSGLREGRRVDQIALRRSRG